MRDVVKVALAGIAGYGDFYLEAMLPRQQSLGARLVGVVDPRPQRCRWLKELADENISVHPDLQSLFAEQKINGLEQNVFFFSAASTIRKLVNNLQTHNLPLLLLLFVPLLLLPLLRLFLLQGWQRLDQRLVQLLQWQLLESSQP